MTNSLLALLLLSLIYVAGASKMVTFINVCVLQAFLLGGIALINRNYEQHQAEFLLVFAETIIIKGILLPRFLLNILKKNKSLKATTSLIPDTLNVVLITTAIIASFLLINKDTNISTVPDFGNKLTFSGFKPMHLVVAISLIAGGIILMVTRNKIFTMVLSFLFVENGIFLLTLSVAHELSILVHIGMLIDLLATMLIMGLFLNKMGFVYSDINTDHLNQLKE